MPFKHSTYLSGYSLCWLLAAVPIACSGCTDNWLRNAFIDPSQTGNFYRNGLVEILPTISFNDKPLGVPGATDPTPEDLVANVEEYRIGPGDVLSVSLLDFLQVGFETTLSPLVVDELGYINIPQLGRVHAEGRTSYELQDDLIQLAKQAEIYSPDSNPTVTVQIMGMQQRLFHITGPSTLVTSGTGTITKPDFRLREAIISAGSLDPLIKTVYVIRNEPRPKRVRDRSMRPNENVPANQDTSTLAPPPVSPVFMSETGGSAAAKAQTRPTSRLAVPADEAERELIEAVEPGKSTSPAAPTTPSTSAQPTAPAPSPSTVPGRSSWQFVDDRFIEVEPATTQSTPQPQAESPGPGPSTAQSQPVNWEELADEGQQRIIRIPADKLRAGEPGVNIVIRHQDLIRLDTGPVGVFYLKGHVARPGTYAFQGEEITLRQALANAGGLDVLAWPSRCAITRRIDETREETLQLDLARIDEGRDPDFYLKPNDLVDVGTHAIAPFLATIRNSFRFTYGFGFVYDRNFADLDAYFPQQNPTDRRRVTLQSRFPGLFP